MAALLFLPFGIRHIARDATLEVYLLGPIANSRQIGFRRYFNDGAEPIEGAARMLSRLLGMHLIFRKPRSVRSLELNPLEQHSMEEMNAERLTDAELMEAVVCRDSDAMGAIYQRYESMLRIVVSSILHDGGETDDVLQEVFIQLWNRADQFLAEKGLQGFLVTLAKRRALDRLRRRLAYGRATDRLETELRAEFSDKMRGPQAKPTTFDLSELLSKMIRLLPEPQQEVVQLTFFKGLSQRDIAVQKSIALGTVKTRLQLARKKLLNQLMPIQSTL